MGYNIAIDGPAGAGKSTIAKKLAKKIGFIYVDTGAMYRAIAFYLLEKGIKPEQEEKIRSQCTNAEVLIAYEGEIQQVILNGSHVNERLREEKVGNMASVISVYPEVRQHLLELQQKLAEQSDCIMDGRDIGTCVLPNAPLKIYLTASVRTRALRRYQELKETGKPADLIMIEDEIQRRDDRDMHREIAPLRQAEDAILIDSSDLNIDEVISKIEELYEKRK